MAHTAGVAPDAVDVRNGTTPGTIVAADDTAGGLPPLVSVIIPAFNCEEWLDECLQSVAEQTYRHLGEVYIPRSSCNLVGMWGGLVD